jgi:serine/threonine-protein kinase
MTIETPSRSQRVYELFQSALEQPPEAWPAFLTHACGPDKSLHGEVAKLLRCHARADTEDFLSELLNGALDQAEPPPPEHPLIGQRLGPYAIRKHLASGGMGSVFEAVRALDYEQVVAIKMLRPELFSGELGERFHIERQALAQLAHPHIARLLDGGTTADGLPYLVMEHIAGQPLDRHCDEQQLSIEQRLRLFEKVCQAVHFAHTQGIIHRDLKPANILVTADGTPKVTDFGLAKRLGHDSAQTQTGQILGSPSYMAPEQAAGRLRDATAATDVYALGAVLYELLTGRPPFKGTTWRETLEQVCTQEPLPPRRLQPGLARDVETICLKCLQKDPQRRYASARALAKDIERFLAGRPIQARPIGQAERLYRWCRRNALVAGLLAGLFVVLIGGLVSVTWLWWLAEDRSTAALKASEEADHQRARAEEGFEQARKAVEDGLIKLSSSKELKTPGLETVRAELLKTALANYMRLAWQRPQDPKLQWEEARSHFRVAQISREIGHPAEAVRLGEMAAARFEEFVRARPESIDDLRYLAWVYSEIGMALGELGRADEDLQAQLKALAVRERIIAQNPAYPRAASDLAWCNTNLGVYWANLQRYTEAQGYFRRARELWPEACRVEPDRVWPRKMWAMTCQHLGTIELESNHAAEALALFKEAHERYVQTAKQAPEDREAEFMVADSCGRLANAYAALAEPDQARRAYARTAELRERMLGAYRAARARYVTPLSITYTEWAKFERAQGQAEPAVALALKRRELWPDNGEELYNVACDLALCIPLVGGDKADEKRRRFGDLALETLQAALKQGFRDWQHLSEDPDFEPLRTRPEFQKLLKMREN